MHRIQRLLVMTSLLALAACGPIDIMREGFEHSQAVSTELENTLGLKSLVGFSWNNGTLTNVTITFQGVPQDTSSLSQIADAAKRSVTSHFKQVPKQLVIGFAVDP